jgi:hypothetical protein
VDNVPVVKIDRSAKSLADALGSIFPGETNPERFRRRASWAIRTDFTLEKILGKIE